MLLIHLNDTPVMKKIIYRKKVVNTCNYNKLYTIWNKINLLTTYIENYFWLIGGLKCQTLFSLGNNAKKHLISVSRFLYFSFIALIQWYLDTWKFLNSREVEVKKGKDFWNFKQLFEDHLSCLSLCPFYIPGE